MCAVRLQREKKVLRSSKKVNSVLNSWLYPYHVVELRKLPGA